MITKFDSSYVGSIDLEDAGYLGKPINDRRYSNEELAQVLHKAVAYAKQMDRLGYDTFWMAEHHFQPEGGSARATVGEAPYGRMLPGIRGLRLEVTGVRAKFKYAGRKPEEVQDRIADGLATRNGPREDRKSTRLNSSHRSLSRMPSSA